MDLREKPGILQRFGEMLLRFRLIFVVVLACVCGYFFAGYTELLTFALAMSEMLGMKVAESNFVALWPWLLLLAVVLVPRFLLGGSRSGFAALVVTVVVPLALFGLLNTETLALPVLIGVAVLSLILFVVVKHGFGCASFPAFLAVAGWIGALGGLPVAYDRLEVAVFATLLASDMFAVALIAGKELKNGSPKNGALLEGVRKQFFPAVIGSVLAAVFFAMRSVAVNGAMDLQIVLMQLGLALGYLVYFYGLGFSLLSFAPFARLRADKRTMNVPKSSGVKKK